MQTMQVGNNKPIARVESDLESLIPSFLNNRKNDLIELKTALDTQNFQSVERIGHILKGVAPSYGFEKLGEYGALLEKAAKNQALKECLELVDLMGIYMRDVTVVFE